MITTETAQSISFTALEQALSAARLTAYRQSGANPTEAIARYRWNSALCGALQPVLGHLEVAFRNSLHRAIATLRQRSDWYNTPGLLSQRETDTVKKAQEELAKVNKSTAPDNIVATLQFGFWTSILSRDYERKLWPQLLLKVFPHVPRTNRTRHFVMNRMNVLRGLRNRVSHLEPIWHWADLLQKYQELRDAISWFDPSLLHLIDITYNFEKIYALGPAYYAIKITP